MPSGSMTPHKVGSYRVYSDKGHSLDQSNNNTLPYGPYKDARGFDDQVFPEKEVPYNHSYMIDRMISPQTHEEERILQI